MFDGHGEDADEDVFRDIYGRSLTADDLLGDPDPDADPDPDPDPDGDPDHEAEQAAL